MIITQNKQTINQAKTVDDYRRDIKLLKLKYLQLQEQYSNQQKKLEWFSKKFATIEQSQKNNLHQNLNDVSHIPNSHNQSQNQSRIQSATNFMSTDQQIMEHFSNRCKLNLGMTPESLFRAADQKNEGVLKDLAFKQFLLKAKLNIKDQHLQRILQLCDTNCSGDITKQGYYEFLQAFQINQEQHIILDETKNGSTSKQNRTFAQKSYFRFCENLIQQMISPYICFKCIDQSNIGEFGYEQFYSFTTKLMKNIKETELIGIYNYLDIEKQSVIGQEYFIIQTKKMMRIVSEEKGINIDSFIDLRPGNDKKTDNNQNKNNKDSNSHNNLESDQFHPNKFIQKQTSVDIKKLLDKFLFNYRSDIPNLLRIIVDNMQDLRSGVLLNDVFNAFSKIKFNRKYTNEDKLYFFKALDSGQNGSVDYDEMIKFYSKYKQQDWPIDFIFYLFSRILLVLDIDAEQYLKYLGFSSDQVLKKQDFIKFSKQVFQIEEENVSVELFQFLDKEQRNDIYVSALIDQINFEIAEQKRVFFGIDPDLNSTNKSFSSNKKANVKNITELESFKEMDKNTKLSQIKKTALSDTNVNLQHMQSIINQIKPQLEEEDYFLKFEVGQDQEIIKTKWDTIMNDEASCLKKCIDIITEMQKNGKFEWTDPEFGPHEEKDPYGGKSMYFNSNEIPLGCPDPEDVKWLRLNEIVDAYVESVGEANLDLKQKQELDHIHFLYEGASSNDVKQSKYLGDCWFVSSLSIISEYNEYVDGEFDPNQSNQTEDQKLFMMSRGTYPPLFHFLQKYGIYVMKFFKNYKWRYVIIDDKLPCLNGEIIYSHCDTKNEFWVSLIEKAYAKIHSCYQALTSGDIGQGLQDLTGNLSIKMKLDNYKITYEDLETQKCPVNIIIGDDKVNTRNTDIDDVWSQLQNSKEMFWKLLYGFKDKGCLIGCSVDGDTESLVTLDGERTGIYSGHAYSLNQLIELNYIDENEKRNHKPENPHQNHRLLIVRNPWGYGEWQLKWSENQDYIEKVEKNMPSIHSYFEQQEKRAKQLGITAPERYEQAEDGKFLICYKDWRRIFNNLFICLMFSDAWSGFRIKGSWNSQFKSGILKKQEQSLIHFAQKNPQYVIELKHNTKSDEKSIPFFINLAQNDGRLYNGEKYPYEKIQQSMMLCIFELSPNEKKLEKFSDEKMITNSGKYNSRREVSLDQRCLLEYGKRYCIIPSIKKEVVESDEEYLFYLNIFGRCNREDFTITKVNGKQDFQIKELGVNAVSQIDYEKTSEFKNILIQSVNKAIKGIKVN